MVAIVKNALTQLVSDNREVRSDSIDSLSSTIGTHDLKIKDANVRHQFYLQSGREDDHSQSFGVVCPSDSFPTGDESVPLLRSILSSIIVLNSTSSPEVKSLLETYDGHLLDIGSHILKGLRDAAPTQLAARVGDWNENLFYEMQECDKDISSIINANEDCNERTCHPLLDKEVKDFEASIRKALGKSDLTYRGSFMQTEETIFQPAHFDYDYAVLEQHGHKLFLAFFPLTEDGAFLQLWKDPMTDACSGQLQVPIDEMEKVEGTVVYIPYGKMLILPSTTIHGGGFRRGRSGNLRFHLYISIEDNNKSKTKQDDNGLIHPVNKYTEKNDRRRELCERFVDPDGLERLIGVFFDS